MSALANPITQPRLPMIVPFVRAGALLLQAVHPDTVLMRQVGQEHNWLDVTATILSIFMSLAVLVISLLLIPAARNFRKNYARLNDVLGRMYNDVKPFAEHAHTIAENMNDITTVVRADVHELHATIAAVNDQLRQAVAISEQRLHEFNALLEVVQQEAESVFVATASTMRGVRMGAASFHHEDDEENAQDAPPSSSEELDDGNDSSDAPETSAARPRIRPRERGWGRA